MTSRELTEWMAYERVDPFSNGRGDLQAAIIASTIANRHRDPKKEKKPYRAEDFMPKFRNEPQSWEQQLAVVEDINTALGGKDIRSKRR